LSALSIPGLAPRGFEGTALPALSIPPTVEKIDSDCFRNCLLLSKVSFASDCLIRELSAWAFFGCVSLEAISLPASVVLIGVGCFAGCTGLARLYFDEPLSAGACSALSIESGAFAGCPLDFDEPLSAGACSALSIESGAFAGCFLPRVVELPKRTQSVGVCCFSSAALVSFRGDPLNCRAGAPLCTFPSSRGSDVGPVELSLGGLMLLRGFDTSYFLRDSRSGEVRITPFSPSPSGGDWHIPRVDCLCPGCFGFSSDPSFVFPEGCSIREIPRAAFLCAKLVSIEIPQSVEILKVRCFCRCLHLTQVTFTSDSRLRELEEFSFAESGLVAIFFLAVFL
jgi:hypothetical protein